MPVILRQNGLRYFFYANEGSPLEPAHVHVRRGRDEAKFSLRPMVFLDYNDGLSLRDLREAADVIEQSRAEMERAWDEFFA